MWLFTKFGFFSVVCNNNRPLDGSPLKGKLKVDKGYVAVRARVRKHLENLVAEFGTLGNPSIIDTPDRDYACRIIVPLGVWAVVQNSLAMRIDYHNFKDAAGKEDAEFARWLSSVWSLGHAVQSRSKNRPQKGDA